MSVSVKPRKYNDERKVHPGLVISGESLAVQSQKDETLIPNILDRFTRTGHLDQRHPMYGDFSDVPADYMDALAKIKTAEERFSSLPAALRKEFNNDPARLVAWLRDPANKDKAVEYGLIKPPEKEVSPTKSAGDPPAPPPST